jgi:hypothetical protein
VAWIIARVLNLSALAVSVVGGRGEDGANPGDGGGGGGGGGAAIVVYSKKIAGVITVTATGGAPGNSGGGTANPGDTGDAGNSTAIEIVV